MKQTKSAIKNYHVRHGHLTNTTVSPVTALLEERERTARPVYRTENYDRSPKPVINPDNPFAKLSSLQKSVEPIDETQLQECDQKFLNRGWGFF